MVFWHPKGWSIWQQVEQYMRRVYQDNGYQEVRARRSSTVRCGRDPATGQNFKENMFTTESEKRDFAIKPMNCPGHIQIFNSDLRSYRDLPLRYGEFGACHRNEPSGALHGIMRVRAFTQDDGHIFCTEDQIQPEVTAFNRLALAVYKRLRLHRRRDQARAAAGEAPRQRRGLGPRRGGAARRRCAPAAPSGPSCPARARSTAPRSSTTSRTRSAARGSAAPSRSTSRCRAGWAPSTSPRTTPGRPR